MSKVSELSYVTLVTLFAFALRLARISLQPLWSDELDLLHFANTVGIESFLDPGWNGALYHLILAKWFNSFGSNVFTLRILSVLAGTLIVPACYKLATLLSKNKPLPIILSILVATSPYLIWYSQDGKMYALRLMISVMVGICILIVTRSPSERNHVGFWLAIIGLSVINWYIHFLSIIFVAVLIWILTLRGISPFKYNKRAYGLRCNLPVCVALAQSTH